MQKIHVYLEPFAASLSPLLKCLNLFTPNVNVNVCVCIKTLVKFYIVLIVTQMQKMGLNVFSTFAFPSP